MTTSIGSSTALSGMTSSALAGSVTNSGSVSGSSSNLDSQSAFLQLLVAQMNNQDPLNPMDSSEMTSQLAQISTVQGIQGLSTQLTSLLSSINNGQTISDSSLVGQNVLVPGNTLALAGGAAQGAFNLASAATQVTVTITNSAGQEVRTMQLGSTAAGNQSFNWNGQTDSGAAAAAGNYTFTVKAVDGQAAVTSTTLAQGKVTAITPSSTGTPSVSVAGLGTFSLSQVDQIN